MHRDDDDEFLYGGSAEPAPLPTGKNFPSKSQHSFVKYDAR